MRSSFSFSLLPFKSTSRQLKQCQPQYVCQESGIYLYIFCLQPVRAASEGFAVLKKWPGSPGL